MPANQKPFNQIGIFGYHLTPRKLLYLMVSVNLVHVGCQFWEATLYHWSSQWRFPLRKSQDRWKHFPFERSSKIIRKQCISHKSKDVNFTFWANSLDFQIRASNSKVLSAGEFSRVHVSWNRRCQPHQNSETHLVSSASLAIMGMNKSIYLIFLLSACIPHVRSVSLVLDTTASVVPPGYTSDLGVLLNNHSRQFLWVRW